MIVSIHQPQYAPWLPYFMKIAESDLFIYLDTVDFQKNGLQNRNQIKTSQGPIWLTVPIYQSLGQKISTTRIDNKVNWRVKHLRTLEQSYGKAPYFEEYFDDLVRFYEREWVFLSEMNVTLTMMMLRWFGINTPVQLASSMNSTGSASALILNLCREVGATHYISGTGGLEYLNLTDFEQAGVSVQFRKSVQPQYPQLWPKHDFIGSLSAFDILFNCGPSWKSYLPSNAMSGPLIHD